MAKLSLIEYPSKASQGEKDTFELLKKLPDDYWVYYEPNINNNFLILL